MTWYILRIIKVWTQSVPCHRAQQKSLLCSQQGVWGNHTGQFASEHTDTYCGDIFPPLSV